MTGPRRARAGTGTALVVLLLAAAPAAGAQVVPTSPEDLPRPTPQQLDASVQVWEPDGVQVWEPAGVRVWDPRGSVERLETQEQDGAETVLTLSSDILFAFDSADLPPAAGARLVGLVAELPDGAAVDVTGHTDSLGGDAYNLDLSERRARAVADVLAGGRPDLRLGVEGLGAAQPVAAETAGGEDDPEGRAQNRRVEIRYGG